MKAVVACDRGTATLTGGDVLRIAVPGGPDRTEDLSAERPGFETLLTLFLRKAVGGLIPAPDLHDLSAAMTLCRAAAASRDAGSRWNSPRRAKGGCGRGDAPWPHPGRV